MIAILLLILKWMLMAMGAMVIVGIILFIAVACLDYQVDKIVEREK